MFQEAGASVQLQHRPLSNDLVQEGEEPGGRRKEVLKGVALSGTNRKGPNR